MRLGGGMPQVVSPWSEERHRATQGEADFDQGMRMSRGGRRELQAVASGERRRGGSEQEAIGEREHE